MPVGVFMSTLEQTGDCIFHVLSVTSILRIQRSQPQIAPQHSDTVHHFQIVIALCQLCGLFEKFFGRYNAIAHALDECKFQADFVKNS